MSVPDEGSISKKSEIERIKSKINSQKYSQFLKIDDLREIKSSSDGTCILCLCSSNKISVIQVTDKRKVQEIDSEIPVKSFLDFKGSLYISGKGIKRYLNYQTAPKTEEITNEDASSISPAKNLLFYISEKKLCKIDLDDLSNKVKTDFTVSAISANSQIVATVHKAELVIFSHDLLKLNHVKLREDYFKLLTFDSDIIVTGGGKKSIQVYNFCKNDLHDYRTAPNHKPIISLTISEELNLVAWIDVDVNFFSVEDFKDEGKIKLEEKYKNQAMNKSICFCLEGKMLFFALGPNVFAMNLAENYLFPQVFDYESDIEDILFNGRVFIKSKGTYSFDVKSKVKEIVTLEDELCTARGVFKILNNKLFQNGAEDSLITQARPVVKVEYVRNSLVVHEDDFTLDVLTPENEVFMFQREIRTDFLGCISGYFFFKYRKAPEVAHTEAISHHHRVESLENRPGELSVLSLFKRGSGEGKNDSLDSLIMTKQVIEIRKGQNGSELVSEKEVEGVVVLFNKTPNFVSFKDWTLNIYDSLETDNYIKIKCNEMIGEPKYFCISDDDLFFFAATDSRLAVWSLYDFKFFGSIFYGTIEKILVQDNSILISSKNQLRLYPNPFHKDAETSLLVPDSHSVKYWISLKQVINWPKLDKYEAYLNSVVILPDCYNILHLFTLYSNEAGIKMALKEGSYFIRSTKLISPFSIIFQQNTLDLIDIFLKSIPRYFSIDENIFYRIEDFIIEINKVSASRILLLYNSILQTPEQRLPKFGTPLKIGNNVNFSDSKIINSNNFVKDLGDSDTNTGFRNSLPVTFKTSSLRLPLRFGTQDSLDFLDSLIKCEKQEVLVTPIISSVLSYKWSKAWRLTLLECILVCSLLVLLLLYNFQYESDQNLLIVIQTLNSLNLVLECLRLSLGFKKYIKKVLNIFDLMRILCIISLLFDWEKESNSIIMAIIIILACIKPVQYLRIFDKTRYFIYIVNCCISDIIPFLAILFYLTFAFAVCFNNLDSIKEEKKLKSFLGAWMHSYSLNFNSYNIGIYQDYKEWLVFFVATVINPLILMNMIIALLGNTYTMVKEKADIADKRELAELIIESESMIFWRRKEKSKKYVQICSSTKISDEEPESIKSFVKEMAANLSLTNDNLDSYIENSQKSASNIKVLLDKVMDEFSGEIEKYESSIRSSPPVLKRISISAN